MMKGYRLICLYLLCVMALLIWLLSACSSIRYVPVETVRTEYQTRTQHDSIYVAMERNDCTVARQQGDTVIVEHWHTAYRDRWRDRVLRDTLLRADSVAVPVPVERPLTRWQQFCLRSGKAMATGCMAAVIIATLTAWLAWRHRKK